MKKIFFALFLITMLAGCGSDGKDGKAYLQFTWDWYVDSYTDNNYDTPSTIDEYVYYQTSPGTYSYSYDCSDGLGNYWSFSGTYTITINEGEDGGLFTDGEDGEDNYFTLSLSGYGRNSQAGNKDVENKKDKANELNCDTVINLSLYDKVKIGEMKTETLYSRFFKLEITKQKYLYNKNKLP